MMQSLLSNLAWTLRRLAVVALVSISLSGVAQSPESESTATRSGTPDRLVAAGARAGAPASNIGAPVQVAAAASAAQGLHRPMANGTDSRMAAADPPAFVLFVAALLAIVFISTRRRKDR
jgi:hypothetical protein